ncbi:MAG: response regulator transcription factor [Ferrovum sp.]|nr:response regulator transcription factor [Ferrovum sp.]
MTPDSCIRVFAITSHQLILAGLNALLTDHPGNFLWLGGHPPTASLFRELERHHPKIVILDDASLNTLPTLSAYLAEHHVELILLTQSEELKGMEAQIQQGVLGIVHVSEPLGSILGALHAVSQQHLWVPARLRERLLTKAFSSIAQKSDNNSSGFFDLSTKEKELIRLIVHHPEARALALGEWLGIQESTLRNRLSRIYQKLHLHGRASLVMFAQQYHLD